MRTHPLLCLLLLLTLLLPSTLLAQSKTAPMDPKMWSESLEIGPVPGLTTIWHAAPVETGVPLHETLQFRIRMPQQTRVVWEGAREVERSRSHSVAEVRLGTVEERTVRVTWTHLNGPEQSATAVLRGIDTTATPIALTPVRVSVDEIEIDRDNPNASTMQYFFRPESIAPLVEVGLDHYRTSVSRWMTVGVGVQPKALAPLVEWSLNGRPQQQLGSRIRLMVYGTREHIIAAGSDAISDREIRLDTYQVKITEETKEQSVLDGVPVTFRAETDPPGYEDEIAWVASTKYGTCAPDTGLGPEFTTVFETTLGEEGRWLGVKASNSIFNLDGKGDSGIFQGSLVTEAVNVGLELDLTQRNDCIGGTWALIGEEGLVLSRGTVFGTRSGQEVSLPLDPLSDIVLVGEISSDGTSLSGSVQDNESPVGTWSGFQCAGPNLVIELPGLDVSPPGSLCSLEGSGNPLVVRNIGSEMSSATALRGRLDCVGPLVDIDVLPVNALDPGEAQNFVIDIPSECTTILSITLTVDPVPGECNTDNTRDNLCVPPVP